MKTNPINDVENRRQKRNLTDSQKKNADLTREGVLVNSLIKENGIDEIYDTMVISDNARMPQKVYEKDNSKDKSLLPISIIATSVMATMALLSFVAKRSAKVNLNILPEKKLPTLTRNLAINEETHQAIYQMVQCPNQKTILAGVGVLTISAMAFMGKMFLDGFKDIWVKKREADIQKNLQENLIAVETQSFSGKIQIVRCMLADKAREFSEYLNNKPEIPLPFKKMMSFDKVGFKGSEKKNIKKESNLKFFALGAFTLGAVVGFGFLSLKNLRKGKGYIEEYVGKTIEKISEIVKKSDTSTKEIDKINLKNMFQAVDAKAEFVEKKLAELNWDEAEKTKFIDEVLFNTTKSTATVEKTMGGDGTPKPAFYSHVNDYRAFFYNWLLETSNPLFKNLFFAITGVSAVSYGGKVLGEAVKDVQVKKINAQTELELQQRLVSTELRNFKAKKEAAINPLCEEFYTQVKNAKPKEELKTMAENILSEVKNGPPFVYS
ncbi:MAG TPA: hypothetical protein PLG15_04730 [Candidatus Gastranaerophilaceae bacterium]|nr:hypothetical protein [Candidatus Gastranaerophilaceae bacterium]HPT41672.1 hypothetical protein [Candidatus Gastranaerophilaceae bacterium]